MTSESETRVDAHEEGKEVMKRHLAGLPPKDIFLANPVLMDRAHLAAGRVLSTDVSERQDLVSDLAHARDTLLALPRYETSLLFPSTEDSPAIWLRGQLASGGAMACFFLTPLSQVRDSPCQGGAKHLSEEQLASVLVDAGVTVGVADVLDELGLPPTTVGAVILYAGAGAPDALVPVAKKTPFGKRVWAEYEAQNGVPEDDQDWINDIAIPGQPLRMRRGSTGAKKGAHHDAFTQGDAVASSTTTIKLGNVDSFPCEFVRDDRVAPFTLPDGDDRVRLSVQTEPGQALLATYFDQRINLPFKHAVLDYSDGVDESITIASFSNEQAGCLDGWEEAVVIEDGSPLVAKPLIDMWVPPDVTPAGRGNGRGAAKKAKAILGRLAGSEDAWELVTEAKAEEWGVRSSRLASVADKKKWGGTERSTSTGHDAKYEFKSADERKRKQRDELYGPTPPPPPPVVPYDGSDTPNQCIFFSPSGAPEVRALDPVMLVEMGLPPPPRKYINAWCCPFAVPKNGYACTPLSIKQGGHARSVRVCMPFQGAKQKGAMVRHLNIAHITGG
tara:strand:+ start:498 stop:2171 length:1674 start_codon:yes stop_codon:yes gene_type:complete